MMTPSLFNGNMTSATDDVTYDVELRPSPLLAGCVVAVIVLAVACAAVGVIYYFIFYSRCQCMSARRRGNGRRLLDPGSGGGTSGHDPIGSGGDRGASTHIFMFKKS